MSRIGKKPIEIPENVTIQLNGNHLKVQGPKGELFWEFSRDIEIHIEKKILEVLPKKQKAEGRISKDTRALWGLTRALIANMIRGVTQGYEKRLELEGVGYRAALEGKNLVLNLGYTNPITLNPPEDVVFQVEKNVIVVSGINKEKVGQWAANVRATRPVEPYKGKGVRYENEIVRRKAGKKAATTGG